MVSYYVHRTYYKKNFITFYIIQIREYIIIWVRIFSRVSIQTCILIMFSNECLFWKKKCSLRDRVRRCEKPSTGKCMIGFIAGGNTAVSNTGEYHRGRRCRRRCRRRHQVGQRAVLRQPSPHIVRARWPNIDRRRRPRYYSRHRHCQYTTLAGPAKVDRRRAFSDTSPDRWGFSATIRVCPQKSRGLDSSLLEPPNRCFSFSPVPTGAVPSAPLHHDPGGRPSQLAHSRPVRPVVTPPYNHGQTQHGHQRHRVRMGVRQG